MRLTAAAFLAATTTVASAQHLDVQLYTVDDKVTTGIVDLDGQGQPVTENVRVFSRVLGEGDNDFATTFPGYNAFSGDLPANAFVGIDIVDALRIWDPIAQDFQTIPGERMRLTFFTAERTTPTDAGGFVDGFFFADTGASGSIHSHITYVLDPEGGQVEPDVGVYLLTLVVKTNAPGVEHSEPMCVVFSNAAAQQDFDDAVAHAETLAHLAPPPACPGDVDGDGSTNLIDFGLMGANFGATGLPHGNGESRGLGDLNDDGDVNLADFSILGFDFGCTP